MTENVASFNKILKFCTKVIYQHTDEWENAEEVDQFKYLGSTQNQDGTSLK